MTQEDIDNILSHVSEMLEKEKTHLRWLVDSKIRFIRKGLNVEEVNAMIDKSAQMVRRYRAGLAEYKEKLTVTNGNTGI